MKKIVFVAQDGYGLPTARVRAYHFAEALSKIGFVTEVIAAFDYFKFDKSLTNTACISDFRKIGLIIKLFLRLIKEKKDTVFYVQKVEYHAVAVFFVSLFKGNPFVIDYDDWEDVRRVFCWLSVETLTKFLVKRSLGVVSSSYYLHLFLSSYSNRAYYIPTVVDETKFLPVAKSEKKEKIVFSWAGIVIGKRIYDNLVFMIEAFKKGVGSAKDRARLEIVGEGVLMPQIAKYIEENAKEFDIAILPRVAPDEMNQYYDAVDVGIIPLLQYTKFNFSKSPTKMFEYMAKGVPVIASRIGEAALIIDNGYDGFLAETQSEFARYIHKFIADSSLVQGMGKAARSKIEHKYCLSKVADDIAVVTGLK